MTITPPRPSAPIEVTRRLILESTADTAIPPRELCPISPVVIPRAAHAKIQQGAVELLALCKRAALSSGDSTKSRLEAYNVTSDDYPLFSADPVFEDRFCDIFARPDFVITDQGPKVLEFNVSGAVGGVPELATLQRGLQSAYRRRDDITWDWENPFDGRARAFEAVAKSDNLDPRVLIIGSTQDLKHSDQPKIFDLEVDALHRRDLVADYCEPDQLLELLNLSHGDSGALFPLSLRMFTIPEWEGLGIDLSGVRAWLEGGSWLLTSQTAAFLANKKTLAWLSEGLPWMTRRDHAIIDEFVPWSRTVSDRCTTLPSHEIGPLLHHLLDHQHGLVLKQGIGMQGLQVTVGKDVTQQAWRSAVQAAVAAEDSMVQEYVEPCLQEVWMSHGPNEDDVELLRARPIVSFFLFGNHAGSGWARYRPNDSFGVVSREGFGAHETAIAPA